MKRFSGLIVIVGFLLIFVSISSGTKNVPAAARGGIGRGQELIGPIDWDCPHDGIFPYELDCSQYVDCWSGNVNLWQCTDNMLFDIQYNGCNFAQYTHCYDIPRPTNVPSTLNPPPSTTPFDPTATTTTTETLPIDFECPSDGVFPHSKCEYYWICYAGVPELYRCSEDYLFDLQYLGCNFPELTDCQDRERPGGSSSPSPATTRPTTVVTSVTASSTPETEGTVNTGSTTTPDPNASTTTSTITTTNSGGEFQCPPGADGDYADPLDCSAFYTCVGGIPYHNYCPAGLYFNPLTDSCDYPANVDCTDRG